MFKRRELAACMLGICAFLAANVFGAETEEVPWCGEPVTHPAFSDPLNKYEMYSEFSIADSFPSFDRAFNLYLTDGVLSRWSEDSVKCFIRSVLDDDSTNATDAFPIVWNYFCHGDSDSTYAGIHVKIGGTEYTKLDIRLYDKDADFAFCYDPDSTVYANIYWRECLGFSYAPSNGVLLAASEYKATNNYRTVDDVVRFGFAHELEHVAWAANGSLVTSYWSSNESLAKLAEHLVNTEWEKRYDVSYDASIYRGERCDPDAKYHVELTWMAYLYEAYDGGSEMSDDLVNRWLRYEKPTGGYEVTMNSLAEVLWQSDYAWLGGDDAAERLQNLFDCYLVAKFADAPDFAPNNRYGYSDNFSPVSDVGITVDNCDFYAPGACPQEPIDCGDLPPSGCGEHLACWNVRIIPPDFVLGTTEKNTSRTMSGIYVDGDDTPADTTDGDKSRDYVDVATYGTDYLRFRADQGLSGENELHIRSPV